MLSVRSQAAQPWPTIAHALLKDLIITYSLFTAPRTPDDHDKVVQLFEKFHTDIKTLGMQLAKNDDILWQLFRTKVGMIQCEMLGQGELKSTPQGLVHVKPPQKKLFPMPQGKDSIATPPTTPILPTEQLSDGMEMWNSMDGNSQARMLRKMLRAAKNPQRMVFECEEYCAEIRSKERQARNDIEQPIKETKPRSTQRPTPSKTPDPISGSLDLQAMIDESLREVKMRRALEKKALDTSDDEVDDKEDSNPKRIKIKPTS